MGIIFICIKHCLFQYFLVILLQVQNSNKKNINAHIFLWLHSFHDFVRLGQNGLPEPILTQFYVHISYYPTAFSLAVNTFIPTNI